MPDSPRPNKFPEVSTDRDYDVFEEMPDGSTVLRACVFGIENVELKFRELAKETTNRIFAINLLDQPVAVIHPFIMFARPNLRRFT
jgi:hypothetical protein